MPLVPVRVRAAVFLLAACALVPGAASADDASPAQDVRQLGCPPGELQAGGLSGAPASAFRSDINCLSGRVDHLREEPGQVRAEPERRARQDGAVQRRRHAQGRPAAAGAARAVLAGQTVIRGSSTGKVPVRLSEPVTLPNVPQGQPGGVTVTGEGRYVGWALVADGGDPARIIITGGRVGTGLPADGTGRDSAVLNLSMTPALDPVAEAWELPAGDYHLYLIADGKPAEVTLPLKGLSGTVALTPAVPVSHRIDRPEPRYGAVGNEGAGSTGTLEGPGLLMQLASTLSTPSVGQVFTNCYYVGENASAEATYAPGCPEADVGLQSVFTNPNIGESSGYLIIAGSLSRFADTFGQGYAMQNVGLTDNVEFSSLWLTF